MFCSRCGNQVTEGVNVCPVCGNEMGGVFAYTPEAVPAEKPKNNGTGLKIGIAVTAVIAVMAIALAVLFATGTLSLNKDKDNNTSVSEVNTPDNTTPQKNEEAKTEEPIVGEIYDLPVVTGDKSVEKVMLKIGFDGGVIDDGELKWLAFDYSDPTEHKAYLCMNMTIPEQIWIKKATMLITKDAMFHLYEGDSNSLTAKVLEFEEDDQNAVELYGAFFGFYNEDFLEECDFKYLGKESLKNTGNAYVYECISNESEDAIKVWIDADTGYWVKREEDGKTVMEVSEIITGDDVEFPEFDFENAVPME